MKLNVGCGIRHLPGYDNIDHVSQREGTIVSDCCALPYDNESCEEIYSSHMIEHLDGQQLSQFFAECNRVLRIGGFIHFVAPSMELELKRFCRGEVPIRYLDNVLFGTHRHPVHMHKQGIYKDKLARLCSDTRFEVVELVFNRNGSESGRLGRPEIVLKARKNAAV